MQPLRPATTARCPPTPFTFPALFRNAVLNQYDYVFAENGLVAYQEGQKLAVQSLVGHLGEKPLQVGEAGEGREGRRRQGEGGKGGQQGEGA